MRTLTLLRHAKSSWDDPAQADFDRPLARRGEKAAPVMGRHMRALGLAPDLVLCSSAVRTRQTAARAFEAFGEPAPPITFDGTIYEAEANVLLDRLRRVPAGIGHLMLIGHNPGLHDLAMGLLGPDLPAEHARLGEKLPTGALLVLACDVRAWSRIGPGTARIEHYVTPRDLA